MHKMASSHLTMEHQLCSSPSKLAVVKKSVADIKGILLFCVDFFHGYCCFMLKCVCVNLNNRLFGPVIKLKLISSCKQFSAKMG